MNSDRYREAYEHYQRQVDKRWPDAVIAPEWDDLGGDMQDCWRAGFDAFDGYLDGTSHLERAEKAEARVVELEARVDFLEFAICRHVLAREGESGERPDITVSALYRIEREVRERTTPSVSDTKGEKA